MYVWDSGYRDEGREIPILEFDATSGIAEGRLVNTHYNAPGIGHLSSMTINEILPGAEKQNGYFLRAPGYQRHHV